MHSEAGVGNCSQDVKLLSMEDLSPARICRIVIVPRRELVLHLEELLLSDSCNLKIYKNHLSRY
jgi:hypothetical protein